MNPQVRLFLAPMEGVTDVSMREILTGIGGIDACVSEFLRVTTSLHPHRVFERYVPELATASRTPTGVPVYLQLLGGQPEPLALNARRAAELGAYGIDLNFGCPAKTVNRHDGGATLLQFPYRIENIVTSVRAAVPQDKTVSVKMRLGFNDSSLLLENALAAESAGASWITIHCRTKMQGYRPPAHWEEAARLKEKLKIPLILNGDIFSVEDFLRCRKITGADAYMLGRGAIKNPFLFWEIKRHLQGADHSPRPWSETRSLVLQHYQFAQRRINDNFATSRTKQWLKFLSLNSTEARQVFDRTKALRSPEFHRELLS